MQIRIEKLVFEGKGLGRNEDNKPFFIKKSVPGDEIEIEVTKTKSSFSEGIIKQVIKPSLLRVATKCPYFDRCGGCDHQNISYQNQLKFKGEIFKETLSRAKIETEISSIIPGSNSEFFYRNVIRFFFAPDQNGKISFAMHDHSDFNKLVPIDSCFLQSETCNKILHEFMKLLNNHGDSKTESWLKSKRMLDSFWQLRIREGKFTNEFMVEIITKSQDLPFKHEIIDLLRSFPNIKSVYHVIATEQSRQWQRRLIFGSPIIYEKIGKFTFQISPESFFQTNSLGAKTLYDKIRIFADIQMGDHILDLFCGTGTIGIYLSMLAKKVIGIEIVQNAINDARANAKINKVSNCNFICADATKWLHDNIEEIKKYKSLKIIVDPPRNGLSKEIIQLLGKLYSFINFQLIYVSCNPTTFARDIKIFEEEGLKLKKAEPFDMFPQTHHIECIGLISGK